MEKLSVDCMEELLAALGERQNKEEKIYLLFCGNVDETTGESWCPDCVKGGLLKEDTNNFNLKVFASSKGKLGVCGFKGADALHWKLEI